VVTGVPEGTNLTDLATSAANERAADLAALEFDLTY
jgi:hypothetical protein